MLQTQLHKLDARPLTDCGRNTGIPRANDINLITDIVTLLLQPAIFVRSLIIDWPARIFHFQLLRKLSPNSIEFCTACTNLLTANIDKD